MSYKRKLTEEVKNKNSDIRCDELPDEVRDLNIIENLSDEVDQPSSASQREAAFSQSEDINYIQENNEEGVPPPYLEDSNRKEHERDLLRLPDYR